MEDRFPGISREQDSEDDEAEDRRPNRNGANFVRRGLPNDAIFRRMFESSRADRLDDDDENEEEDDDAVVSEKRRSTNRRFRRSFGKLFRRRIIAGPQLLAEDKPSDLESSSHNNAEAIVPLHNFSDWLRKMTGGLDEDQPETSSVESGQNDPENNLDRPRISVAELLSRISSEVEEEGSNPASVRHTEQLPTGNEVLEEPENTPELGFGTLGNDETSGVEVVSTPEPIDQAESIQQIMQRQSAGEAGSDGVFMPADRSETGTGNTTTINETYNTVNGWGPALVVDQLSRRRDRKIRRHVSSQDERITHIEQGRVDDRQEALNNLQYLQSKVEKIQQSVVNPDRRGEKPAMQSSQGEQLKPPVALPEKFVPRTTEYGNNWQKEQVKVAENVEKITTAEVIQKTVEKAAEAAVPIESLYERRHEIKGNDDFASSADAAIKTIVENPSNGGLPVETDSYESAVRRLEKDQKGKTARQNDLYSQAARGGALLAVLIIIAFLVIYMLNR